MTTQDLYGYYCGKKCAFDYPFDLIITFIKQCYNINNRITMLPRVLSNGVIKQKRYDDKDTDEKFISLIKKVLPKYIDCGKIITNLKDDTNSSINMTFIKKQLVFDIDASDYDNTNDNRLGLLTAFNNNNNIIKSLRVCDCQGTKRVCKDCWYLLSSASLILLYFIKNLFGDETKILWVYSGNRGIHCWLKDSDLDLFNSHQRESIIEDISLETDKEIINILNTNNPLYMDLLTNTLYPFFIKYIITNKPLFNKLKPLILQFIKVYYTTIYNNLANLWNDHKSEEDHWNIFESISKLYTEWKYQNHKLPSPHLFIIMRLLYIILDKRVTKEVSHLLKLPYSIHKTTNRLSFPLTQDQIMDFPINDEIFLNYITIGSHKECQTTTSCPVYKLMEDSKCLLKYWLK